jgi:hypothetical protein
MGDLFADGPSGHDPGGRARFRLQPGITGKAEFSPCGQYRYWLSRDWGWRRFTDGREPFALWIGMNPSTAEANIDDPTIRREMSFTKAMRLDCYVKVNVMDYRATDPKRLLGIDVLPCSPDNAVNIGKFAKRAERVIAAWGALPKPLRHYADAVLRELDGVTIYCMGRTADGSPRHPLYLSRDAKPLIWREGRDAG